MTLNDFSLHQWCILLTRARWGCASDNGMVSKTRLILSFQMKYPSHIAYSKLQERFKKCPMLRYLACFLALILYYLHATLRYVGSVKIIGEGNSLVLWPLFSCHKNRFWIERVFIQFDMETAKSTETFLVGGKECRVDWEDRKWRYSF